MAGNGLTHFQEEKGPAWSVGAPAMAEKDRYSRAYVGPDGPSRPRRRQRASPSPLRVEVEGECRWPVPERKGRSWGGERGTPRRPPRAREEPEGPSWSPETQEGRGGSSWRDSNLEGEGRSWLPPGGEEDWGPPVRSPQEAKRESRWGSLEPPPKRARSPQIGGWRGSLSPPKGRTWTSPMAHRQSSSLSSCTLAQGKHSSSRSGKGSSPRYPHSHPVSRDRQDDLKWESRGRSPTRHKGPSTTWDPESPRAPIRRVAEGRSRGLEEPGGGGGGGSNSSISSHRRSRWEPRQGYPEDQRKGRGGSGERWRESSFQDLPQGDWGSHPNKGGKRVLDLTGLLRDQQGLQEWKEDPKESRSFSPQSWFSLKKRRRRSGAREQIGTEEESWARVGGRERCRRPTQDQDDWAILPEVLEDWISKEGREGKESSQRGSSGRPAKCLTPAVGWVPSEEVVNYWKQCQSLLPKMMKSHFLSTCPRPTIPDGSTRIPRLNWSLLDLLNSRQVLKISSETRYSFASQAELMEMLAPAMALYEMAESAIEDQQVVDPLDVQELARRLICYVGSLNHSLTMQRCSQVLGMLAPQLRGMTNQISSRNANSLLFAEEKVKLIEDVILTSMEEEKEVNLNSSWSSDWEAETQDYTSLELWHRRFAHAESKAILQLHKHNLGVTIKVNPGDIERIDQCVVCLADKGKKPSFLLKTVINTTRLLDLIHCELCGPFSVPSKGKHRYALIFVDDFSRYCVTYLLRRLHETHKYFKQYFAMLSRLREAGDPKAFQFNSAGESVSHRMKLFLEQQGIPHKSGVKENPGQSRTAAREMASLLEMTRCMLADAHLPNHFWDSAIMAATYLLNRLPIIGRKKTPFQVWQGSMPSIRHIRVFGSLAYSRNTSYIFTGYDLCRKGYTVMNLETGNFSRKWPIHIDEHKRVDRRLTVLAAFEGHDAEPLLATTGLTEAKRKESGDNTEDESNTHGDEEPEADEPKEASSPLSTPEPDIGYSELLLRNEPATWEDIEEMSADEAKKWHDAAREEIEVLLKNATWALTKLPPGKHAIGCKWVFKVKPGTEGQGECYTAQLVLQKPGEDVGATVTPDVKLSTTRMLLSISASKQMQVKHLKIKPASLHGEATEELYMEQPPGFVDQKHPDWVCKLKKDLHGLTEASQAWNKKLEKILSQQGFKQDEADPSLYRRSRDGNLTFILACTNDLVVASQHEEDYEEIVCSLNKVVEVKELGDATGYLGSQTERAVDGSSLLK